MAGDARDDAPPSPFSVRSVTPLVTVGRFRAEPQHPEFADLRPARYTSFAFSRRAVLIVRSSRERIVATPNVVTFYNAGDEYGREAIDPDGDFADFFVLHPSLLVPILESTRRSGPVDAERPYRAHQLHSDAPSYLEQRRLTRYLERTPAPDGLLVEETVVRLLEQILTYNGTTGPAAGRPARESATARQRALVERTAALLADRFRENLTLSALAAAVGGSPAHLSRVFRAGTGCSLHRYRHELRLYAALELVAEPGRDLTDIALELGFSSHSHFTCAFRNEFGLAPTSFRSNASSRRSRDAIAAQTARRRPSPGRPGEVRARSR